MLCQTWEIQRQIWHCLCVQRANNLVYLTRWQGILFICGTNTYQLPTMCQAHLLSAGHRVVSKSMCYRFPALMGLIVYQSITPALKITRVGKEPCSPSPQISLSWSLLQQCTVFLCRFWSLRNITLWLGRHYCILNYTKPNVLRKK